jgi:hypothetical protein
MDEQPSKQPNVLSGSGVPDDVGARAEDDYRAVGRELSFHEFVLSAYDRNGLKVFRLCRVTKLLVCSQERRDPGSPAPTAQED